AIKSIGRITLIIVAAVLGLHSMYALAQSEQHPLAPPELSSPRDTLRSFMTLMDNAYQRWKTEGRTYANRAERGAITRLAHQLFVSEPGWMIPRSLIGALPGWMQLRPGGQAVWQWCALVLTLLVTAVLMVLIFRLAGYWSRTRRGAGYYLAMVFPVFAMILPQ